MPEGGSATKVSYCLNCWTPDVLKLGYCSVCGKMVCEKCGNVQHARGEIKPIHDACLTSGGGDGHFSMIKFVK